VTGGDRLGKLAPELEVAHPELVALVAVQVHEVREEPVIGRRLERAEAEVVAAGGEIVLVEHDLLGRVERLAPPAMDRVLLAGLGARVVPPPVHLLGHGEVGLLDPAEHLVVELPLELRRRRHERRGPRILGLEIGAHLRVLTVAEPLPVVRPRIAVMEMDVRMPWRERWPFGGRGPLVSRLRLLVPPGRTPRIGDGGPPRGPGPGPVHHAQVLLCHWIPPILPIAPRRPLRAVPRGTQSTWEDRRGQGNSCNSANHSSAITCEGEWGHIGMRCTGLSCAVEFTVQQRGRRCTRRNARCTH
jgi:hypothetical protein